MRPDKVTFYRDHAKRWRWKYVASNGRILADSGQGYSRRIDAMRSAARVVGETRGLQELAVEVER